ncbi:unnamed protein product [Cuscuta campestris]|uniref:Uncharacterized protein n=1 Tax=Cuscuta campestris TaxID=132261 RepID=A0A484KM87_9ASTE|nr:unnamed protein product [Cuscuta campestris]
MSTQQNGKLEVNRPEVKKWHSHWRLLSIWEKKRQLKHLPSLFPRVHHLDLPHFPHLLPSNSNVWMSSPL